MDQREKKADKAPPPAASTVASTAPMDEIARSDDEPTMNLRRQPSAIGNLARLLERWGMTDELGAKLIWDEYCFRKSHGEPISLDDLLETFPRYRSEVDKLRQAAGAAQTNRFPVLGDVVGGFQLVAELGRGGQGQVFLARQLPLANRPVVLKLTACHGVEHLNLARLQHTYIVPLFGAEDFPERNLRLLCMPFLGAITLSEMITCLARVPLAQRSGRDVNRVLEEVQAEFARDLPGRGNAAAQLSNDSYETIICRMGMCLAESLDYAHDHGLVHLDIKPSNVLVAPDGMPLLLDFHLARKPLPKGETKLGDFGGTWRYMAPEQRAAVTAASGVDGIPAPVDHRSDIYSLGLVLHDALGGERDLDENPQPGRLRAFNPRVSAGLAAIVSRCLAENPDQRYASAGDLAEDLRRHLDDRPLRHVPNRSWVEAWRKWRRRRPLALPVYGIVLLLFTLAFAASLVAISEFHDRNQMAEKALWEGQDLLRKTRYEEAAAAFRQGQERLAFLPGNAPLRAVLAAHRRQAEYLHKAQVLHGTVSSLRYYSLIEPLPRRSLMVLDSMAKNLWRDRAVFRAQGEMPVEAEIKERIQADLCELALVRAQMQVRLAAPERQKEAAQAALELLEEAETEFGPQPAILVDRRHYADRLGQAPLRDRLDAALEDVDPRTAGELAFLGRAYLRAGGHAKAEVYLRRSLDGKPLQTLASFDLGYCLYRQGKYEEGIGVFSFCIGRDPRAESFYFRALCLIAVGKKDAARNDLSQALERDAYLGQAYLHRGILHAEAAQWDAARSDFTQALANGADPTSAKCELARVHIEQRDWHSARTILDSVLLENPQLPAALSLRRKIPEEPDVDSLKKP